MKRSKSKSPFFVLLLVALIMVALLPTDKLLDRVVYLLDSSSQGDVTPISDNEVTPEVTPTPVPVPDFEIHQIAVGCANAYLIKCGDVTVFIDGGESDHRTKVLNYIANQGISTLDVYIATHFHGDHVDNMTAICNQYQVSTIMAVTESLPSKYTPSTGSYIQMVDGGVYDFGYFELLCIGPYKYSNGANNYDSLNFIFKYKDQSFLFTGDYCFSDKVLEKYSEEISDVDVFQFPHHGLYCGGTFYVSAEALRTINPKIILVPANSSGKSQNFASSNGISASFYDNKSGSVVITANGTDLTVRTEK